MSQGSNWTIWNWKEDPEESANAATHGLGFLLSILGAIILMASVIRGGDIWRVLGCLIYAPSLVMVYAMSTLSHAQTSPAWRHKFRMLDQGFIYILIAGTYTPFSLAFLRSGYWWIFLGVMWAIAIAGFLSKTVLAHRIDSVSVWIYVVMGWMPIAAASSLVGVVPDAALWWMLIGGLCYTAGTVFLINDHMKPHFHSVWHLAVIAGSACHFFVILCYVAPVTG